MPEQDQDDKVQVSSAIVDNVIGGWRGISAVKDWSKDAALRDEWFLRYLKFFARHSCLQ
jgi:hypothetical protein